MSRCQPSLSKCVLEHTVAVESLHSLTSPVLNIKEDFPFLTWPERNQTHEEAILFWVNPDDQIVNLYHCSTSVYNIVLQYCVKMKFNVSLLWMWKWGEYSTVFVITAEVLGNTSTLRHLAHSSALDYAMVLFAHWWHELIMHLVCFKWW